MTQRQSRGSGNGLLLGLFFLLAFLGAIAFGSSDESRMGGASVLNYLLEWCSEFQQLRKEGWCRDSNFCSWGPRISCTKYYPSQISIDFSNLNLDGDAPELDLIEWYDAGFIVNLTFSNNPKLEDLEDFDILYNLEYLDLSNTGYDEELEDGNLHLLSNLRYLNLSHTQAEGTIPWSWSSLSQMQTLDLSYTRVQGTFALSSASGGWSGLEVLRLAGTRVTKVLENLQPNDLSSLVELDISYPTASLPDSGLPSSILYWLQSTPNLEFLNFNGYPYRNCVPFGVSSFPVFMRAARAANVALVSSNCNTESCVTTSYMNADTKNFLQLLRDNLPSLGAQWTGSPSCNWPGISCGKTCGPGLTVDLTSLELSGALPDVFQTINGGAVQVDSFSLRATPSFVSSIPASFFNSLQLARKIDLTDSGFMGSFPSFNNANFFLESVMVGGTNLCGDLPAWGVENFPQLRAVDFSSCNFRGSLAGSWSSLNLEDVKLQGNEFCGCIPAEWNSSGTLWSALTDSVLSDVTSDLCASMNACGNVNKKCSRLPVADWTDETRKFLLLLATSFPSQLSTWGKDNNICGGNWKGVSCNDGAAGGVVAVSIDLSNAGLTGSLPQIPASLSAPRVLIESINLSGNSGIQSTLPSSWGRLSYLQEINLDRCTGIQGDLPDAWSGMTLLRKISIVQGNLCRGLPMWSAASMPNLKSVNLYSNWMMGGLNEMFGTFKGQLTYFNYSGNSYCGCIPSSWDDPVLLQGIGAKDTSCTAPRKCTASLLRCYYQSGENPRVLDHNAAFLESLKGALSDDLALHVESAKALSMLSTWKFSSDADYCLGWDGIRCSFVWGQNGYTVDLSGVGLRGTLPDISNLDSLYMVVRSINLSGNPNIKGTLPPSWGKLASLVTLDLSGTSVNSALPSSWQNMQNLQVLSASKTLMCGLLPKWSADNLVSIQSIDLSSNKLAGALPSSWSAFAEASLDSLKLSGNSGLCSCTPNGWVNGATLPEAIVDAFGTLPSTRDDCTQGCAAPPSCVNPDGDSGSTEGSGSDVAMARSSTTLFTMLVLFFTFLFST